RRRKKKDAVHQVTSHISCAAAPVRFDTASRPAFIHVEKMSKAFTRESDDSGEEAALSRASTLPSGARNRMTVDGAERLQKELAALADQKAQLEETGEGEISRDELRRVTSRMQALSQRLADAEVIAISE